MPEIRSLRPALTDGTTFWVAPLGGQHLDIVEAFDTVEQFRELYLRSDSNGFVSDEMIFYDRAMAWQYAWKHDLLHSYVKREAKELGWGEDNGWLNSYDLAAVDEPLAKKRREEAHAAAMARLAADREKRAAELADAYKGEFANDNAL